MPATLVFARAEKFDWTVLDCLNWFLYDYADATIASAPEWQA